MSENYVSFDDMRQLLGLMRSKTDEELAKVSGQIGLTDEQLEEILAIIEE